MDDLLALFAEQKDESNSLSEPSDDDDGASLLASSAANSYNKRRKRPRPADEYNNAANVAAAASIEQQLGMRVTLTLTATVSVLDILDVLGSATYQSCTVLAASACTTVPSSISDGAAQCHNKLPISTIGVVFHSNTGATLVSKHGHAFGRLQMGTLITGPIITVLLFGMAHKEHQKHCRKGSMVAIHQAKVMPPPSNCNNAPSSSSSKKNDTFLTLSISNVDQLHVLGTATDYAACRAPMRGKNERGTWVADAKMCGAPVDMRIAGPYCAQHKQQHTGKIRSNKNGGGGPANKMHKLRDEHNQTGQMTLRQLQTTVAQPPMMGRFGGPVNADLTFQLNESVLRPPSTTTANATCNTSSTKFSAKSNTILKAASTPVVPTTTTAVAMTGNPYQPRRRLSEPPQPMTQPAATSTTSFAQQVTSSLLHARPPSNVILAATAIEPRCGPSSRAAVSSAAAPPPSLPQPPPPPPSSSVPIDIFASHNLNATTKRTSLVAACQGKASAATRRTINVAGRQDFDGTVPVPQSKLLTTRNPIKKITTKSTTYDAALKARQVRLRHKELAKQVGISTNVVAPSAATMTVRHNKKKKNATQHTTLPVKSTFADAFGGGGDGSVVDAAAAAAPSRFVREYQAEQYLLARQAVKRLQEQEEKQQKCQGGDSSRRILTEWHCCSCARIFPQRPMICVRAGHAVQQRRRIMEHIDDATTQDGVRQVVSGELRVGQGLQWSDFSAAAASSRFS